VTENESERSNGHPGAEEIAAYLSSALGPDERAALEAHLSRCRACRRQVTSAQTLLHTRPRLARWIAAAAVAAAVIALIGPWSFRDAIRPTASREIERATPVATPDGGIIALAPAEGDTITASGARFTWRGRGADVLYRLTLTDSRARAVWTTDTPDTSIVLPPDVRFAPGAVYFWYVDALGANAASWTTGTRAFVVGP
jgi:putative zinc finger protein